jgi:hypothetical protein
MNHTFRARPERPKYIGLSRYDKILCKHKTASKNAAVLLYELPVIAYNIVPAGISIGIINHANLYSALVFIDLRMELLYDRQAELEKPRCKNNLGGNPLPNHGHDCISGFGCGN